MEMVMVLRVSGARPSTRFTLNTKPRLGKSTRPDQPDEPDHAAIPALVVELIPSHQAVIKITAAVRQASQLPLAKSCGCGPFWLQS